MSGTTWRNDNNFLNMDPNAEKVSFTSDENAEPNTLQIIMRTEEISVTMTRSFSMRRQRRRM